MNVNTYFIVWKCVAAMLTAVRMFLEVLCRTVPLVIGECDNVQLWWWSLVVNLLQAPSAGAEGNASASLKSRLHQ